MKKKFITFVSMLIASVLLASMCFMAACGGGGGHNHVDKNGDGICDSCGNPVGSGEGDEQPEDPGEVEEGSIRVTIHFQRKEGYAGCDIWMWYGSVDGRGYNLTPDSYGAYAYVDVPEGTESVGYIIRTNCSDPGGVAWGTATKDATEDDRTIPISDRFIKDGCLDVYTKAGDKKNYLSNDGGKTLEEMKLVELADITTALNTIQFTISPAAKITADMVSLKDGSGNDIAIASITSSGTSGKITLSSNLDLAKAYTLTIEGYGSAPVVPNTFFGTRQFENSYKYTGELGVEFSADTVTFRLWAPTTTSVTLNIYDSGTQGEGTAKTHTLTGGSANEKGVWSITLPRNEVENKYYTYTVVNSLGTHEVVDPYAFSVGLNGRRGMVLDLDKANPSGWNSAPYSVPGVTNYTDANIWEIHVRDFSNMNSVQKAEYRGKYKAFTETNLTNSDGIPVGVNYLKKLGITHVHLLPSFDYATVEEQASTAFNWGYDPLNYNAPEGSYSTDPAPGEVRVKEYKEMVQALHSQNIGVIMDVVYNHTSGVDSNFQMIVPYYYYRFKGDGKPWGGSGCGNETASNRAMFRKFMVDSVIHWLKDYNVDGFRFDLMALHDMDTMKEIEKAVHAIKPNALIYGEGWTGGGSGLAEGNQARLENIRKVNSDNPNGNGIAMFNNVTRDALKGSTNGSDTGYATGGIATTESANYAAQVMFGVLGGVANSSLSVPSSISYWGSAPNPTAVVNYASAHDNLALYDKLLLAYKDKNTRLARNRLVGAIVQTSLGIPFMQAGEEMLRSKPNGDGTYNENSYNASDSVNNLKWANLTKNSDEYAMMQYYSGLIAFRRAHSVLRSTVSSVVQKGTANVIQGTLIQFQMTNGSDTIYVVYNAGTSGTSITLPSGNWGLYINGTQAGTTQIGGNVSGPQSVAAVSCYVWVKK